MTSIAIIEAGSPPISSPLAGKNISRLTVLPSALCALSERQWEQDERNARADKRKADDVELLGERPFRRDDTPLHLSAEGGARRELRCRRTCRNEAKLLRLALPR